LVLDNQLFSPQNYGMDNESVVYKDKFTTINAPSYSEFLKLLYSQYKIFKETKTSPFGERIRVELEFYQRNEG
jgi:hypothetical protein